MIDPERVVVSTADVPPHPAVLTGIRELGYAAPRCPPSATYPAIPSPLGIRAEPLGGIALARGAFLSDLTQR